MNYISVNGQFKPAHEPALSVSNRGYRYGDGLFETMKAVGGKVQLTTFHFERLFSGLELLEYKVPSEFSSQNISDQIATLCQKNGTGELARIRLSVSRGDGGLYDGDTDTLQYVIECWPLEQKMTTLNEIGLNIGIYPDAKKSCDKFSNLKSSSALIYSVAARYANEMQWNDALVMNSNGNIADSTIANIFIIRDNELITPPLQEGCVNGVMRRYIMEYFKVREEYVTLKQLHNADEIFLTNAIRGIQWVGKMDKKNFSNEMILRIYNQIQPALL